MGNYIDNWEKTRKEGRFKYSLIQGSILALVFTLIKERNIVWEILIGVNTNFTFIFTEFIWHLIGSVLGYYTIVWWYRERFYKKEKGYDIS